MDSEARQRIPFDELRVALERVLSEHFGARRRVRRLRRRLSPYSSSCAMENLDVELDRGPRLRLVLKDLSPGALLWTARHVRPRFLYNPRREIEIYRRLLDPQRMGTPICYGAVERAEPERHWLFLERVAGPLLWQVGRMEWWEEAARWLVRLHAEFGPEMQRQRRNQFAHHVRYDAPFYGVWLERAEEFLRRRGAAVSRDALRRFGRLADRYDRVIKRLTALPTTFIHGEFYPSNVIVRRASPRRRICPIDWEVAALGPGLIDLAALTTGGWSEDDRKRMLAAYREACEPVGGRRPSLTDLNESVAWGQLHLAVQWLGWAADWAPPEQHARDWLREALRLADILGL